MFNYKILSGDDYTFVAVSLIEAAEQPLSSPTALGDGKVTIGYGYTFNRNDNVAEFAAAGITLTGPQSRLSKQSIMLRRVKRIVWRFGCI
jgi:hypothetical protein